MSEVVLKSGDTHNRLVRRLSNARRMNTDRAFIGLFFHLPYNIVRPVDKLSVPKPRSSNILRLFRQRGVRVATCRIVQHIQFRGFINRVGDKGDLLEPEKKQEV